MSNLLTYNERSWAIDIISEINLLSASMNKPIKRAGGENTLKLQKGRMFPDVLLFGDHHGASVLQGWELKMPDTSISDSDFINNAEEKARRLNLNSFMLWNASEAVLYILKDKAFEPMKNWSIKEIKNRADVTLHHNAWKILLKDIINELNDYFAKGTLQPTKPDIALNDQVYADFLHHYAGTQSTIIETCCLNDADFESTVDLWYEENKLETKPLNKYQALAQTVIIHWLNKFVFAHYLKLFNNHAEQIESIDASVSVPQALHIFDDITSHCDFMNVFKAPAGLQHVDTNLWGALLELNVLLTNLNFKAIPQESFHNIIDTALAYSRKKLAGQFSTPSALADFLVRITIKDRSKHVIDTCCGTGTIAKSVYNLKRAKGLSVQDALGTTWASDKFAFPLQLSSIALSDPLGMGEIVQTFKKDALLLNVNDEVMFTEPYSGTEVPRKIPRMHAVTSNLPFVRFENIEKLNPHIKPIKNAIEEAAPKLNTKADLYAYLALKLKDLLEENGRLGLITSNSWLGVEWGEGFKKELLNHFNILRVIISGNGRWFSNANVVTTIIVLEAKSTASQANNKICFIRTLKPIDTWDESDVQSMTAKTLASLPMPNLLAANSLNQKTISNYESIGVGWNAMFVDLSWVDTVQKQLVPINTLFVVKRGERRGWDKMFYPQEGHPIEPQYIQPVLKSSRDLGGKLLIKAEDEAFCCSATLNNMKKSVHLGALNWINRFDGGFNNADKPLTESLARANHYWYEMKADTMADIVVSMNPDKKLCFHRLKERSFVNQRLIRLTKLESNPSVNICHALLNSAVGMFLLEALGFGRGLGALDINATKISKQLHVLNPDLISSEDRSRILLAFEPLLLRPAKDLPKELIQNDRIAFDNTVLQAYKLSNREQIYSSLMALYNLRQTARI